MNTDLKKQLKKHLAKSNGKLSLRQNIPNVFFVPSLNEVLNHLGFNPRFENIAKMVAKKYGTTLTLSESSQRNLYHDGIGVNSIIKIIDWLKNIPKQALITQILKMAFSFNSLRAQVAGSTSSEWLPFLSGLKLGENGDGLTVEHNGHVFNAENSLLVQFLTNRCKIQDLHLKAARIAIQNRSFDPRNTVEVWSRIKDLWLNHSQVPKEQLDKIETIANSASTSLEEKAAYKEELQLAFLYLEYDFYLEAIALIEVEFLLLQKNHPDIQIENHWQGLLGKSISAYALDDVNGDSNSARCCFGGLLYALLKMQAANDDTSKKDAGWRQLSKFIEIDSGESSEDLSERQYKTIKNWRKGKDKPSPKAFNRFSNLFLKSLGESGDDSLALHYRITVMFDKLESRILANAVAKVVTKEKIKEVLTQYPIYHQRCLKRYVEE
ncbi:MAG: hypothetical protein RPS47_19350 [Colwellia sp.]|jgi:hypothetical protein